LATSLLYFHKINDSLTETSKAKAKEMDKNGNKIPQQTRQHYRDRLVFVRTIPTEQMRSCSCGSEVHVAE